jgi:DNA polymerase-3 subunit beta
VRIDQIDGKLALEATDLETGVRIILPDEGPKTPIVTPFERFSAWTRCLDGDEIILHASDRKATLRCADARASIPLLDAGTWPNIVIPDCGSHRIELLQGQFSRALCFAQVAISDDASRYTLAGAKIEGNGSEVSVVATDGHRMLVYRFDATAELDFLLPSKQIKILCGLLAEDDSAVDISIDQWITAHLCKQVVTDTGNAAHYYVASKQIAGQFPAWKAVLPSGPHKTAVVPATKLMVSIERAGLLSDDSTALDLTFTPGELQIHAANAEYGEADESIVITGDLDGKRVIRVNGDYLRGMVKKLSCDLTILLYEAAASPLVIQAEPHEGESLTYILMPMRR